MRPRLSHRNALRRGLRTQHGRGAAGRNRPPAALRNRHRNAGEQAILYARRSFRPQGRRRRRRAGGARLRASAGRKRPRRGDLRRARKIRRPQRIRHRCL
ncbi:hypothetical protein N0Q91_05210 [Sinorhizobium sp. K101]|nr:hypothetical protein N0Q91_05210 [Sinorhizobium sp. K101]